MDGVWVKLFESGGVSGIWIVVAFLVSNLFTFLTARGTSKDKTKSDLLTKTIERQDSLDQRQQNMMDDLQEEIRRVKLNMEDIQKEAVKEQKRNYILSEKYTNLLADNHTLQSLVLQLKQEKEVLSKQVQELIDKNIGLVEQIRELTEAMKKKEGQA